MTKTRIMILVGGFFALAACGRLLWLMIEDQSWVWSLGAGVYMGVLIPVLIGMWKGKSVPFRMSRFLALIMLGFGCYAANFAWTFWLFQEPTLMDRVRAVAHPQISSYLVGPLLWLLLSFLPKIREQFKG